MLDLGKAKLRFSRTERAPAHVKPPHSFRHHLKVLLIGFSGAAVSVFAQGVATTGSVGMLSIPAPSPSDTIVSLPLHRPDVYRGIIESSNGAVVTLSQASFDADAFNDQFYLLLESGSGEGWWFPITDTSGSSLTLDLGPTADSSPLQQDVLVKIVPFWTLDSVFPNGRGVNASGNLLPVTRVLLPDSARSGIRLAPGSSFFYFSGAGHGGEGWRKFGQDPSAKFDDQILPPGVSMIVRHDGGTETVFENLGVVQTSAFSSRLGTLSPNLAQDHSMGSGIPVPVSLSDSRLFESGAFTASANLEDPADQLLIYNQSAPGKNRSPASVYYYYGGLQSGGPGWRLLGAPGIIQNATEVFQPAQGFVIRKAADPVPVSTRWTVRPAYLDLP